MKREPEKLIVRTEINGERKNIQFKIENLK